jgi:hypothetical protein
MSKKTSTAALESICKGRLPNRRRAPRHPAGGKRGNERLGEFGQACIAVRPEDSMNGNTVRGAADKLRVILPVILRITFSLLLWTVGAMSMTIAEAHTQGCGLVREAAVGRTRIENPRRPADANHDTSGRDSSEKITRGSLDGELYQ